MLQNKVDQPCCMNRLSHGDIVVLEAVQTSTAYAVQVADSQAGSPALLLLSSTPAQQAVGQWACLEVVEQGEWLGLRSLLLEGLFLQARKKSPHLVFFSPRLGVWEQWKAEPVYQGVLQQHSPALCLTSRQVPTVTLSVRAWKIGSLFAPLPPHVNTVYSQSVFHTAQDLNPGQWAEEAPAAAEEEDANCGASVTSSLQDDALELSHNVVKGYVVRVLKWPLYFAFRVWRAAARAGRLRRAAAAAHHERWLQSTAWVAIQQRAAVERHDRHMIVLACQCWAKQRARRVARAMQAWHARAQRSARLERLCRLSQQKRRRSCTAAVLAAWSRYTLEQHRHRLQCRTVRLRLAAHQARSVLQAWRDTASEQRRMLRALQQRRRHQLLRAALSHWSGVTSRLLAARQAVHTFVATAVTTALQAIFQAWRTQCNRRRHLTARTQVLVAAVARRRLAAVWCAWRGLVDDTASRRRRVDFLHVIRQQHLIGRVLRRWMVLVRQAATLHFAAAQLALRHKRQLLSRAFAAWRATAGLGNNGLLDSGGPDEAVARVMVALRRRLTAERRRAMARGVLAAWRRLSSPREPARFAALAFLRMRDHTQARAVLTHWGACVQLLKESRLEFLRRRRFSILRSALRAWAGQAAYCKRLSSTAALVTRRSRFHQLRSSFGTWQRQACHGQELWSRAVQAHGGFLTRRVMASWRRRCRVVRAVLAGLARCRKGYEAELLKAAIQALRAKAERRRAVRDCQRERARALARHAMKAWRSRAAYSVQLRALSARLQANLRRCVARGVLRSWFLVSHAAVLQLHVLEAMRAASLGGTGRVEHVSAVPTHAMPSTGAALPATIAPHGQRNPYLTPALPLPPSALSLRPVLHRLLVTSLGGATATGGRGGASATLEIAELLRTRLPALARLAARTRQQALAIFSAWRLAAGDGARLRATAMRLQRRFRHLALRKSLCYWAAAVADVRERRRAAMRMVRHTVRGLIARCLAVWQQQARYSARLRQTCLMLLGRRTARLRKATLAAWRGEVRAAYARMQEARKLRGDARTALLRRAVCAWRVAVDDAAEVREAAEKRYAAAWNRAKRQLLHSWRQVAVLQQQHVTACVRVLQARVARRMMAQIIMAWALLAQLERQRREDWPQLCRVFYAWRTLVQPAGRAAAAAAANLAELEFAELGSVCVLRRSGAQDANERAAKPAPFDDPPAKPTDASSSSAGLHPSVANVAAADVQRPASPPPELSMPLHRGAGPHEDQGQQGMFQAPAGPGALAPASYLWQQWYHMMQGGGFGGLPSGPRPLPLAPGDWGIVPGAAAAAQAESAAEAGLLRERLEKLEEAMMKRQQPRESDEQRSSKDRAAQAVVAAANPPDCQPQPPPPAPAQVSSSRIMTATCRPEPGPLYQIRQQQASVIALGGTSSKSVTNSVSMASQGASVSGNLATSPPLEAQKEIQDRGGGGDVAAAGAGTSSATQTSAEVAAEAAQLPQAVGSAATPSADQVPTQLAGVQGTPSKALMASCHPESGPLYQVRAGSNTVVGRASISSLPGPEGLGSPSDSVISSVMSTETEAPATSALPLAPQPVNKDCSERPGPGPVKVATGDTPTPSSPPRPSAPAPGSPYKIQTASCRPEPRPQCQVNQDTSSVVDRASSKSLTGFESTDSVNSSTTSILAASVQPAQAAAALQTQPAKADRKDHQAVASADSTLEVAAGAASTFAVARLSPRAAAVLTASCRPEPGPLCQIRQSSSNAPSRTSIKSVDAVETTDSIISSLSTRATAGSLALEGKDGSPPKDCSPAKSGADGTASTATAPSAGPAMRPPPPPPAPAQALTSRVLTASCLPEPGPLYQIRQGSTTTVGRASSRSLSGFEAMESLASSSVTGASSPSSAVPALAPTPTQPQTVNVVIHSYGPPPPTGLREADFRFNSSSATTAEGSSSLGSPTSLQAWSRRTTAELSGVSEDAEQRSEAARKQSMDLAPGAVVQPATAEVVGFGGRQSQEWGWQQQRHAGSTDSTQDMLAAAARRLLSGHEAVEDEEAQRRQPRAQAHAELQLQPPGRRDVAQASSQSAALFAQPATGPTMSFAPEPSSLPQQRQQHGQPQYPALPEGVGLAQQVAHQQPTQLSGDQVDGASLAASLATAGAVLLPGGQIAQLVLPLQGAILQDPRLGTVSSLLQSLTGLSQPPLEQPLLIAPQSPPAAPPLQGLQASTQQAAQGFHVARHVHDIQQRSGTYGGSQRPTPGAAPGAGGLLAPPGVASGTAQAPVQLGTGYPYPMLQDRPVQVSTAQAHASVTGPWQPSLAPQGDQAAAFFPASADVSKGAQSIGVHPLERGPQAGGQLFSSSGEVRVAPFAVLAASAAAASTMGAPDMSELEAMLGKLEARSRSAMSSPRRLQQTSASNDAAVARPLPLLGTRSVAATKEGRSLGSGRSGAGGGTPLLGLLGLDGIDALHVRATTLSGPGATIFSMPAGRPSNADSDIWASGAPARPSISAAHTFSAHALARPPDSATQGAEVVDPVDAALRRLEAASIHAHVAAAAWSAATGEVAAAAADSAADPSGDREMARLTAAVAATAAVTTAATEQPGHGPNRVDAGAGAAMAAATAGGLPWPHLVRPAGRVPGSGRVTGHPVVGGSAADLLATFLPGAEQLLVQRHPASETQPPSRDCSRQRLPPANQELHVGTQKIQGTPRLSGSGFAESNSVRPPELPIALGRQVPSTQPEAVDGDSSGSIDEVCPTCGSPTRVRVSPSPPLQASAPPQQAQKGKHPDAAGTGESRRQQQHVLGVDQDMGELRDYPAGHEAAERRELNGDGGWAAMDSGGGNAGDSNAPIVRHPAAAHRSEAKQSTPLPSSKVALNQQAAKRQQGTQQEGRQQEQRHQQRPLQQQQQSPQRTTAVVDPLQEVVELAKRRGKHHLADTLAELAGEASLHGLRAAAGRPHTGHSVLPPPQPPRITQTASECLGARSDTQASRLQTESWVHIAPACGPSVASAASQPLQSVRSMDSMGSKSSSSGPGDSISGSSYAAAADDFDPDPLQSPLRRMLGECRRLQSTAAWREEQGDAVVREVVAELSPRQAVAAALAAMLQSQPGPGAQPAVGLAGRRLLAPAGRRL